jgi:hypothetical protein
MQEAGERDLQLRIGEEADALARQLLAVAGERFFGAGMGPP